MIDPRIWLLDAAVELGLPLDTLIAPNCSEALNRRPHGHTPETIAETIAQMVGLGEITLEGPPGGSAIRGALTASRILDLMSVHRRCWYLLTELGGTEWERWAKPQWSRYSTSCSRENTCAIVAATPWVANEMLGLEEYLQPQRIIVQESTRRRTISNWRATYWKTLPEGHLIAFRTRAQPRGKWIPMPRGEWARWVDLRQFYLKPAECGF